MLKQPLYMCTCVHAWTHVNFANKMSVVHTQLKAHMKNRTMMSSIFFVIIDTLL